MSAKYLLAPSLFLFACSSSIADGSAEKGQQGGSDPIDNADSIFAPSPAVPVDGDESTLNIEEPMAEEGSEEKLDDCDATLELIIRDFKAGHPDFLNGYNGQDDVGCGMVKPDLLIGSDGSRQPEFQNGRGTGKRSVNEKIVSCQDWDYDPPDEIQSASSFGDWYANVDGTNVVVEKTLELTDSGNGKFVYDSEGTAGFFPVDGLGWADETQGHNFGFTTEAHVRFGYELGQEFEFSGDDDMWIFVNGRLALDLGGKHNELTAKIVFDDLADELDIVPGQTYNMDIYHAERQPASSNFRVETNISCFEVVEVPVVIR
ncbi:MAG: fibro-slime domain-containing protein [Polyangiaceae bacterium]|nr:fibro-slime domain-containing protein [Polyangiaceae bacterium]